MSSKGWKRFSSLSRTKAIADHSHRQPVKRILLGPWAFHFCAFHCTFTPEVQPGFLVSFKFQALIFFFLCPTNTVLLKETRVHKALSLWALGSPGHRERTRLQVSYGFIKKRLYSSCFLSLSEFPLRIISKNGEEMKCSNGEEFLLQLEKWECVISNYTDNVLAKIPHKQNCWADKNLANSRTFLHLVTIQKILPENSFVQDTPKDVEMDIISTLEAHNLVAQALICLSH